MTTSPTVLTVRSTLDVLALVPVVLGFHPTESLVLLTFGSAKNMPDGMPSGELSGGFHARVDMPTRADDVPAVIEPLRQAVRRHRAQLGAIVVFGREVELGRLAAAEAAFAFAREGLELVEVAQVHDGHWWQLPPGRRSPRHWRPERHAFDVSTHPILAQRVFEGHVVLESRQAVADSLRSGDETDVRRVRAAVDRVTDRLCRHLGAELGRDEDGASVARRVRDAEVAWLTELLAEPPPLTPDHVARVLTLAQMTSVRDRACAGLTRLQARDQLPVWREVVRRAPAELVSGAAGVLALVAWLVGDGALAWCAVDRCLEAEPGNSLAAHVAAALQNAVPPGAWDGERSA